MQQGLIVGWVIVPIADVQIPQINLYTGLGRCMGVSIEFWVDQVRDFRLAANF